MIFLNSDIKAAAGRVICTVFPQAESFHLFVMCYLQDTFYHKVSHKWTVVLFFLLPSERHSNLLWQSERGPVWRSSDRTTLWLCVRGGRRQRAGETSALLQSLPSVRPRWREGQRGTCGSSEKFKSCLNSGHSARPNVEHMDGSGLGGLNKFYLCHAENRNILYLMV